MASPAPAKSQPLHNFSLPHHLTWKKNHTSTAASAADHHHHRSPTRISTPPPPPQPSSSSDLRRQSSHYFDLPRRQSYPSSTFAAAHVSRRHSPLFGSLPKQSLLHESHESESSESDFRQKRSPASTSRRETFPSESYSASAAAAAHKSLVPENPRSDETKSTQTDPKFSFSNTTTTTTLPQCREGSHLRWGKGGSDVRSLTPALHERRKRSNVSIRFNKNKLDQTIQDEDQDKSTAAEVDEESEPKTWNLRPRRPINKQSNVNGNVGFHKHGGTLSKELRSSMNNEIIGINPVEKKEKKMKFSISLSLSHNEIEEDLFALTGSKPSRRPKKRTKTVQRQIETLLPGLWLGPINADTYKVSEAPSKV